MNEFLHHLWNVNVALFTIPWFNYPMSFIELLWIAVDIIDIPLYWVKGVKFVCLLYCIFLFLAIRGLVRWYKEYQASKENEDGEYACPGGCD